LFTAEASFGQGIQFFGHATTFAELATLFLALIIFAYCTVAVVEEIAFPFGFLLFLVTHFSSLQVCIENKKAPEDSF